MSDFKGQTRIVELKEKNMVLGANGSGKTTILKSVLWLLTGKDPNGKSNVELFDNTKELSQNTPPAKVTAEIEIGGKTVHSLTRQATAKFKRPKGQTEYVKDDSDEYRFFIDEMPVSSTDFNDWVSNMIADKNMLPYCLCGSMFSKTAASDKMAAREILTSIVGETEPGDRKFKELKGVPVEDTITKCRYRIKIAGDTMSKCETEAEMARRELAGIKKNMDYERDFEKEISEAESECMDAFDKMSEKMAAYNEYLKKSADYEDEKKKAFADMENCDREIDALSTDREHVMSKIERLKYQIDSNSTKCPLCGKDIKMTPDKRNEVNKMIHELVEEAAYLKDEIQKKKCRKKEIKESMPTPPNKVRQPNVNWERRMHGEALSKRGEIMSAYEEHRRSASRITELEGVITTAAKTVREMAVEIAEKERTLILAEEYRQAKADLLSEKINKLLKHTRIEMFERQKNGDMKPSCTITDSNGVKLSTLNMAAQLLCEVEISRMFCGLLGANIPCFIDECSVFDSDHLPKIEGAQMVYMKCSDDTSLKVLSE